MAPPELLAAGSRWAGFSLLLAAGASLADRRPARASWGTLGHRAGAAYDRSAAGRRLRARLDAADLHLTPSAWQRTQLLLIGGGGLLCSAVTGSLPAGLSLAAALIRGGGRVLLRVRSGRRDEVLEEIAAAAARHLATELLSGAAAAEALRRLAATPDVARRPAPARLVGSAVARVDAGEGGAVALQVAAAGLPEGRGSRAWRLLAFHLDLSTRGGAGTGGLVRLAAGVEAARQARGQARSGLAEVRATAAGIPVVSAAAGVLLLLGDPALGAAALSFPTLPICAVLAAVATAGTVVCRRLASV